MTSEATSVETSRMSILERDGKSLFRRHCKFLASALFLSTLLMACASDNSEYLSSRDSRSLYVASGGCYAGGVTPSAGSGTVARYNVSTGALRDVIVDYNQFSPGDVPVGIAEYDSDNILILVENTSGRRVDIARKDGSSIATYLTNSTAFGTVLRSLARLSDGSILVSKTSAIEKFSPGKARVTQDATNPFINNPAGICATTNTDVNGIATLSNGKILYAHNGASPNNKIVLIAATGYAAGGDCLATQTAPVATALPTGVLVHSSGSVLVPYGSTTASSNYIYAYDLDPVGNTFSNATAAYTDFSIVNAPSAIAEDTVTGHVFVANGNSSYNNIEKFSFNPTTRTLTLIGTGPFISNSLFTRCVSAMSVLEDP